MIDHTRHIALLSLRSALHCYEAADVREHAVRTRMLQACMTQAHVFTRNTFPAHFTASAWIIDAAATGTVLMHHRKLERWLQPGGHADGELDLCAVALREAQEETGLQSLQLAGTAIFDLDIHLIPARADEPAQADEPAHEHFDVRYCFHADRDETPRVNSEAYDVRWVPFMQLHHFSVEPSIARLYKKTIIASS